VGDHVTAAVLEPLVMEWDRLRVRTTARTSVVHAMHVGLHEVSGTIVAFLDDDAVPARDWSKRLIAHYRERPDLGGVGGRDRIGGLDGERRAEVVGKITWWGAIHGHHESGWGEARPADILKGVNMSFSRQALLRIDWPFELRGQGAEPHHEIYICAKLRRLNYRLIYDPAVIVDHFIADRHAGQKRTIHNLDEATCWGFNMGCAIRQLPTARLVACSLWWTCRTVLSVLWHAAGRGAGQDAPKRWHYTARSILAFYDGLTRNIRAGARLPISYLR
jgi:hypothetical protein